jgi:hypothetical protein
MARKNQWKRITSPETLIPDKNIDTLINKDITDQLRYYSKEAVGFLKISTDVFAQMVNSRNTSSGRRVFASSSKQGGGSEIARKSCSSGDRQQRRATV